MHRALIFIMLAAFTASAANLLENSSFEAGGMRGWSRDAYNLNGTNYFTYDISTPLWTSNGTHAVTLQAPTGNGNFRLTSRMYRLVKNTQYTFSVWARATFTGSTGYGTVSLFVNNSRFGQDQYIAQFAPASLSDTNWDRYSFTFTTTNDNACTYYFQLGVQGSLLPPNNFVTVDCLQLETGASATAWAPVSPVEIGGEFDTAHPAHIFYDTDTPRVTTVAFNNTLNNSNVVVNWNLYDYWNALRASGQATLPASAGVSTTNVLAMPNEGRGAFRCVFWINGVASSANEVTYTVVPSPVVLTGGRTASHFGSHIGPLNEMAMKAAHRLGIHWNRDFYSGEWNQFEPTQNSFVFDTNLVGLLRSYDIEPVLNTPASSTFTSGPRVNTPLIPDYATNSADFWPDNTMMSNLFYNLVLTNKGVGRYYEIGNEYPGTTQYTNHLIFASGAMKLADPTAKIVAPADPTDNTMTNIVAIVGTGVFDLWSVHFYPFQSDWSTRTLIASEGMSHFNKTGWNSETGFRFDSFYHENPWYELQNQSSSTLLPTGAGYTRDYRWRIPVQVDNFAQTMGQSITGVYFYFDCRTTGGFDGDVAFSLMDYNNTAQPWAASYAWLANLFEGTTAFGPVNLNSNLVQCFYWTNGAQTIASFVSSDMLNTHYAADSVSMNKTNVLRPIAIGSSQSATWYDVNGNKLTAPVVVGSSPVFAVSSATTNLFLSGLTATAIADTNAPRPQITVWPTSLTGTQFTWEWSAGDDTCFNTWTNINTNAIQYAYQLVGVDAGFSAWTNAQWATYTGLTPGNNYTFNLMARDAAGNTSSTLATVNTGPQSLGPAVVMGAGVTFGSGVTFGQ